MLFAYPGFIFRKKLHFSWKLKDISRLFCSWQVCMRQNIIGSPFTRKKIFLRTYSIQVAYVDATINLWGIESKIKVITNWKVSIDPRCLNKLGKILKVQTKLNSKYGEYNELMNFLTKTGMNFLDLIDLQECEFFDLVNSIYMNQCHLVKQDLLEGPSYTSVMCWDDMGILPAVRSSISRYLVQ